MDLLGVHSAAKFRLDNDEMPIGSHHSIALQRGWTLPLKDVTEFRLRFLSLTRDVGVDGAGLQSRLHVGVPSTRKPLFAAHGVGLQAVFLVQGCQRQNQGQQGAVGCTGVGERRTLAFQCFRVHFRDDQRHAINASKSTGVGKNADATVDPKGFEFGSLCSWQGGKGEDNALTHEIRYGGGIGDITHRQVGQFRSWFFKHPWNIPQCTFVKPWRACNGGQFKPRVVCEPLLETLGHKTARTEHSDLESFHAQANGPCPLRASKVTSTVQGRFGG